MFSSPGAYLGLLRMEDMMITIDAITDTLNALNWSYGRGRITYISFEHMSYNQRGSARRQMQYQADMRTFRLVGDTLHFIDRQRKIQPYYDRELAPPPVIVAHVGNLEQWQFYQVEFPWSVPDLKKLTNTLQHVNGSRVHTRYNEDHSIVAIDLCNSTESVYNNTRNIHDICLSRSEIKSGDSGQRQFQ